MDRSRAAVNPPSRLPRWLPWLLALPAVSFASVFFVLPVATLLQRSITTEAFRAIMHDASIRRVVWFTAWQAAVSTVLTVAIGLVPAYLLSRYDFPARRWVAALITGSLPVGLHGFIEGILRWQHRASAYALLLTDEYPPFSLN